MRFPSLFKSLFLSLVFAGARVFAAEGDTAPVISSVVASNVTFTSASVVVSLSDVGVGNGIVGVTVRAMQGDTKVGTIGTGNATVGSPAICPITGLVAGQTYSLQVTARGQNKIEASDASASFTTPAYTQPVVDAVLVSPGYTTATATVSFVSFGDGSSTVSVRVDALDEGGVSVSHATGSATDLAGVSCVLSSLADGTAYTLRTTATGANGLPATPQDTPFSTRTFTAPVLDSVSVTEVDSQSVTLSVALASPGAGSSSGVALAVDILDVSGVSVKHTTGSVAPGSPALCTLSGLSANTAYIAKITLTGSNGKVLVDTGTSFTTLPNTPPQIGAVSVSSVTYTGASVAVGLSDVGRGNASVSVRVEAIAPNGSAVCRSVGTANSAAGCTVSLSGLSQATTYTLRITISGANGLVTTDENTSFTTHAAGPPVLENLAISSIAGYSAVLSFDVTDFGAGNNSATFRFDAFAPNGSSVFHSTASASTPGTLTKTISSLSLNTTYNVRIIATGSLGSSVTNETLSFTTKTNSTPIIFGPATATVETNGQHATIAVPVLNLSGAPATVSLLLNGVKVSSWTVAEEGPLSYRAYVHPGSTNGFEFVGQSSTFTARASGSFIATTLHGWFNVRFSSDPGYNVGTEWTDVSHVAEPGGDWTKPADDLSELVASNRTVRLDGSKGILYRPTSPSEKGADVVFEGRFTATLHELIPEADPSQKSGWCLVASSEGTAVPYALSAGSWIEMAWTDEPIAPGSWYDLRGTYDFMSADAPRVRWSVNGTNVVVAATGSPWVPLESGMSSLSTLTLSGTGHAGDFRGSYYSLLSVSHPIEAPVFWDGPDSLSFAGEGSTATFSVTIAEPIEGAWYTMFTSTTLTGEFVSEGTSVHAMDTDVQAGVLALSVSARENSKFVRVVASTEPIEEGITLASILAANGDE